MTAQRYYLLNRAAQIAPDGWIHIVPKGELANSAAGMVQVLDDVALDSILRNLESEKAKLGNRWPGLYAGREHFIYDDGQDSAALAWFKEFEKRPDGIWANADGLTPTGRQAIANAEYKFTSFVADLKDTETLGDNRARILRIDTVGFTNQANGKELLTPMTNRGTAPAPVASAKKPAPPRPWLAARCETSFPSRMGHVGSDIFQGVVAILRNRTQQDHSTAFNKTQQANADLFKPDYGSMDTAMTFHRLLNRVENRTGLSPMAATERSADDVMALTKRFAPPFVCEPAAAQWDLLSRAANELDRAGVAERLFNRSAPEDVGARDWKTATGRAGDVFALLDSEAPKQIDRGAMLETAPASQVRGVFRSAIDRLMSEDGLNRRQAFDRLKETEPVFWTLAMLSFET